VYDAPNFEALMVFSMEPAMVKVLDMYDCDVWLAMTMEEVMQNLMRPM
jgi:hypothetical protein